MKLRLVLAAALAATALPLSAHAQAWLSDRRYTEGIGIRVGNLELHPGVGAEFGYDSNFFQRDDSEGVVDVYRLRVTPSLSLGTLSRERIREAGGGDPLFEFRIAGFAAYNHLFPGGSDARDDSAEEDDFGGQRDHVTFGVTLNGSVSPRGRFGFDFHGDYQYISEPSNSEEEIFAFNRAAARGGAGVSWRPGGGLFEWRFAYDALYNYFLEDQFSGFDNLNHRFQVRGRWRFLPRTALIYDGSYTLIRYVNDEGSEVADIAAPDGELVRSRFGISGLLTYRLALSASVGWASSFYDGQLEDADTITAGAEAKYFIMAPPSAEQPSASTGFSTASLGYVRDISNSYLSAWYARDRVYASVTYLLGGMLVTSLEAGYSHVSYPEGPIVREFTQNRIDARLFAEYRFSDTLGANGTLRYDTNMSDDLEPRVGTGAVEELDFVRWQAYIGLRWFM